MSARAASFDCSKVKRPVEKAICGDAQLSGADDALGRVYRAALARLTSGSVGLLRADQVQWLAWAQQVCHADDAQASTAAMAKCLLPVFRERTKQLYGAVARRSGVSFLTRTQYLAQPGTQPRDIDGPEFAGFGVLRVSWPIADAADERWLAWNKAMEAHAYLLARQDDDAKSASSSEPVWTAKLAEARDADVNLRVKKVEHERVTTGLSTETMMHGGAHPSEIYQTLTWLLDGKHLLTAGDVFADGSEWKAIVANACWKAISTGEQKANLYPEVTGPNAKQLQSVIADTFNWTLEPDGLHISYPEYSVSPRIAPVDDTVISWTQLRPMLASGFVTP